jgi:hypothetical protein
LALAAGLLTGPAAAQVIMPTFYVGADFQHTRVSYSDIAPGLNGGDFFSEALSGGHFHAGARISPMFGAEVGYLWIPEHEKSLSGGTSSIDVNGVTLDALFYMPMDATGAFELVGLGGASRLTATAKLNGPAFGNIVDEDSEWGWRAGGGAQFRISRNVNVRGLVLYQSADFEGDVESSVQLSIGVNFLFP